LWARVLDAVILNTLQKANAVLDRWRRDPVAMVHEELGVQDIDDFQLDLLRGYAAGQTKIAMKSAKGPGKTAGLAWVGMNFIATRPGQVKIGATSITGDNIDMNLWPEFHKWIDRSEFFKTLLVWTKTRISDRRDPENRFIERRTWPKKGNKEEQSDALAGFHGEHIMWLIDEVGGIPQAVVVTAEAIFATEGQEAILIMAGNPTDPSGPLYRVCTRDRAQWYVITITGDPDNPKRSRRISIEHARKQIASYGRDNPWVMVNILGEFPPSAINSLLGVEDVEAAMHRHLPPELYRHMQKRLGVDVARFGDDRTVIFPRQGLASWKPVIMRHQRTDEIAARVLMAKARWGSEVELIDNTYHWGNGVIDQLILAGAGPIGVNYAGKAIDPRFKNRRAEMYIKGAKPIRDGQAALPFIPQLIAELTEQTYTFQGGQFVLEDKDLIKERLGFSPDLADGYMTTYAIEDLPARIIQQLRQSDRAKRDGDPYESAADRDRVSLGRVDVDQDPYLIDL
jgi:phage terminase large subunit